MRYIVAAILMLVLLSCRDSNPIASLRDPDIVWTSNREYQKGSGTLFVLGYITNRSDRAVSVVPVMGLFTDPAATESVMEVSGIVADSVYHNLFGYPAYYVLDQKNFIDTHQSAQYLITSPDIRGLVEQYENLYQYQWFIVKYK